MCMKEMRVWERRLFEGRFQGDNAKELVEGKGKSEPESLGMR